MSVAQTRPARRKIRLRYRNASMRSVSESIAAERRKAAREHAADGSKNK